MKKIFIFLILTTSLFSSAQMAVTDVGVSMSMTEQIAKSTAQLAQLEKNYELMKKSVDKLEKINNAINGVFDMKEIIELQKEAIENVKLINEKTAHSNSKYNQESKKNLTKGLEDINKSIQRIINLLKTGYFSMSDKERIDALNQEKDKIFLQTFTTRVKAIKYK